MESLEVVDVFCTASECATTFTSNFSTISIFIIFHFFCFWIFSFWHAKCWRGVLQDEFLIIFWVKHDHISSRFNMWPLTRIILFPTLIFVILSQISKSCMWAKFGEEFLRWVIMIRKVLSSKSIKSQLFNALSNVSISLLVAEISSFEVQKYPQ